MAKIAKILANKGKLGDDVILSEETWKLMHSDPSTEVQSLGGNRTTYSKGGICIFGFDKFDTKVTFPTERYIKNITPILEDCLNAKRSGYVGW